MKLSLFIDQHIEEMLAEWDAFAKTLLPSGSPADLRTHARQILRAIELDLETVQSAAAGARHGAVSAARACVLAIRPGPLIQFSQ